MARLKPCPTRITLLPHKLFILRVSVAARAIALDLTPQAEAYATRNFPFALFAAVQPPQKPADQRADADGPENERPGHGNGEKSNDDHSDRHDRSGFRSGHGHISERQTLRLRLLPVRCLLKHESDRKSESSNGAILALLAIRETKIDQSISTTDPRAPAGFASSREATARAIAKMLFAPGASGPSRATGFPVSPPIRICGSISISPSRGTP